MKAIDLREESQHAQVSKPKGSKSSSKFCSQQCQRYGNWKFFDPAASATETIEFSVECSQQPLQLNPANQNSQESSTSISGSQPASQPLELPVRPPVADQLDNNSNSNAYSPSDFDEMDLDDPDGLDDDVGMDIPLDEQLPDSPMDI